MATKQLVVGEEDPLRQQFRTLERDWNSYKHSIPRHRRAISGGRDDKTTTLIGDTLLEQSPKELISSLQLQCEKIQGRNLMEALEGAKDDDEADNVNVSPMCRSVCSLVLIQEVEGSSSSNHDGGLTSLPCSSCSDSDIYVDSLDQEDGEKSRRSREEIWVVRMISVFVAVWAVVVGIMLAMGAFGGQEKYDNCVTPT